MASLPLYSWQCILPTVNATITATSIAGPPESSPFFYSLHLQIHSINQKLTQKYLGHLVRVLYIGTSEGKIGIYPIKFNSEKNLFSCNVETERACGHGKKPVTDILVMDDVGIVLTLCDGYLDTWNALSLEPTTVVPQNKAISIVRRCQSGNEMTYQICVQQKKKLYLYEFVGRFELISEFTLPEPALDILWMNKSLYLAYKNEYTVFNLVENRLDQLLAVDSDPLMRTLSNGELLLKHDKKGLLVEGSNGHFGQPLTIPGSTLTWSSSPLDLVVHFPYLISLLSDSIEIHSSFSWKMFQKFPLNTNLNSTYMSSTSSNSTSIPTLKGFVPRNTVLVQYDELFFLAYNDKSVFAFVAPNYPIQAESLVKAGHIEEGLFLFKETCEHLKDYHSIVSHLHSIAAWTRFKSCDWKRAMIHFQNCNALPSTIIPCFPSLLLNEAQKSRDEEKIINNVIKKHFKLNDNEIEKQLREACIYFIEYLEEMHKKHTYDESTQLQLICAIFIGKAKYAQTTLAMTTNSLSPSTNTLPSSTNTSSSSKNSLSSPITSSNILWNFLTSLSESDISLSSGLLEHWCNSNKYYITLGLLYRLKRFNRRALEEWSKVASGQLICVEPELNATYESISLLQTLNDVELLEEFAPIVYRNCKGDAEMFLSIFASKQRTTLMPLNWLRVFLSKFDPSLLEKYLEYLVFELDTKDENAETLLANFYVNQMQTSNDSNTSDSSSSNTNDILLTYRKKMLNLLETRSNFDGAALLLRIESLPFHHEKVAIYEKMREYEKALSVILNVLNDFERAEEFCLKHTPKESLNDSLFALVLKAYISYDAQFKNDHMQDEIVGGGDEPHDRHQSVSRKALDFLNRFSAFIRPTTVLSILPADTPISLISNYLTQSMRNNLSTLRQQAVTVGIEKSMNTTITAERLRQSQKSFLITHDTSCPICNKRIDTHMFARYPNNVLIHYHCMKNSRIDPLTGRNFYTHPAD